MKIFSVWWLSFFVCSVLWATQGLAIYVSGGLSQHYQQGQFSWKCPPYFPSATLPLSSPRCPFFPPTATSPSSAKPFTSPSKQSMQPPLDIRPCDSCLQDIEACVGDIFDSFWTFKPNFGPSCCKAVTEISQDCLNLLFPPFINAYLVPYLKKICSALPRDA